MVCPSYPEIDIAEWGELLEEQLQGKRYPLSGTIELTERCNLSCVHCYINQPGNSPAARSVELTTDQVKDIIDQVAAAGCLFLTITGGEPLLRTDFAEIYRHAKHNGLLINLFTNATMVSAPIADLLAELPPRAIDITLYGATPHTYERVTRLPGSFQKAIQGIRLLVERDLPVHLKSVLLTINAHELPEMRALSEELGFEFRFDSLLWPRIDGSTTPLHYQLPLEEVLRLDQQDPERFAEIARVVEAFGGQVLRDQSVYGCGAGYRSFHIDSAGQMSICAMSRTHTFDLTRFGFDECWEQLGSIRQQKRTQQSPCLTCTEAQLCTQCPGWSQAVHGDDETVVEFVCDLARMRVGQHQHCQFQHAEEF